MVSIRLMKPYGLMGSRERERKEGRKEKRIQIGEEGKCGRKGGRKERMQWKENIEVGTTLGKEKRGVR